MAMVTTAKLYRCFVCDYESESHRQILLHFKITDGHLKEFENLVAEATTEQDITSLAPTDEGSLRDRSLRQQLVHSVEFCDRFYRDHGSLATAFSSPPPDLNIFSLDVSLFRCTKCDFFTSDHRSLQKHLSLSSDSARLGLVRYAFQFFCQQCSFNKSRVYDSLQDYAYHLYNCHHSKAEAVQATAKLVDTIADPAIITDLTVTNFQCHLCPVSRCSLSSLHAHFKSIHSAEFFPINKIVVNLQNFKLDEMVDSLVVPKSTEVYQCYKCEKKFFISIAIKKHFEECHSDELFDVKKAMLKVESTTALSESDKPRQRCHLYRCKTCINFWTFDECRLEKHYKSRSHRKYLEKSEPMDHDQGLKIASVNVQKSQTVPSDDLSESLEECQEKCVEEKAIVEIAHTSETQKEKEVVEKTDMTVDAIEDKSNFECKPCGQIYPMKCHLIRHLNSRKHLEVVKSGQLPTKDPPAEVTEEEYVCTPCQYSSSHRWNFQCHLTTKKHRILCNVKDENIEISETNETVKATEGVEEVTEDSEEYECIPCEFKTKFRKTWESHKNHRNHKILLKEAELEYQSVQNFEGVDALDKSERACTDCDYEAPTAKGLKIHRTKQHEFPIETTSPNVETTEIPDSTETPEEPNINGGVELTIVFRHSSPSKEDEFRCSQCDFRCQVEADLNAHLHDLHQSSGAEFVDDSNSNMVGDTWKCQHCPRLFSSPVSLKRHCTWKHGPKAQLFNKIRSDGQEIRCGLCPRVFDSQMSLKRHCTWKHPGTQLNFDSMDQPDIREGEVDQSREEFNQPAVQKPVAKVKCLHCPREFDNEGSLKRHCTWKHPRQIEGSAESIENVEQSLMLEAPIMPLRPQFVCQTCGFRGKNLKAINGHWNKKKSCRISRTDASETTEEASEILEFTTPNLDEQVTFDCPDCSFRGVSKKSLLIHISCKHRKRKSAEEVPEPPPLEVKKAKTAVESEEFPEDEDEDAREIIDSIVQDIPVKASKPPVDNINYYTMTTVEDEIQFSDDEGLDELEEAEDEKEDDFAEEDEDLHLFIEDDDQELFKITDQSGKILAKSPPTSNGSESIISDHKSIEKAVCEERELMKCDHCEFSNFHQDVMAVHKLVHKQEHRQTETKDYKTIQEETICMCCAHCSFKTKDFATMMEHNKHEHPEL